MGHKLYVKSQIKPYLASRQIPSLYPTAIRILGSCATVSLVATTSSSWINLI